MPLYEARIPLGRPYEEEWRLDSVYDWGVRKPAMSSTINSRTPDYIISKVSAKSLIPRTQACGTNSVDTRSHALPAGIGSDRLSKGMAIGFVTGLAGVALVISVDRNIKAGSASIYGSSRRRRYSPASSGVRACIA